MEQEKGSVNLTLHHLQDVRAQLAAVQNDIEDARSRLALLKEELAVERSFRMYHEKRFSEFHDMLKTINRRSGISDG